MTCENCLNESKMTVAINGINIQLCKSCYKAYKKGVFNDKDLLYMHKVFMNKQTK